MFLTFYTNEAPKQLTWDDILNDPYITSPIASGNKKKITKEITDEYAERLWTKKSAGLGINWETPRELTKGILPDEHYRHFQIPKKSNPNKMRKIDAPDETLSAIQTTYKAIVEEQLQVLPHKAAHAYVAKHSTVTAMQTHQRNESKWFLQMDLKNFFNSCTGPWLKYMLKQVYPFKFIEEIDLDMLIKASLLKEVLPQGSHLSPLLTNLAMVPIDYEITEKLHNLNGHHYIYTRYADDITISCKEKFDPEQIQQIIRGVFRKYDVPFKVNNEKTRFGSSSGRNYHLGLILNKDNKISVGHEKNNKFRAKIYNFCLVGEEWDVHEIQKMLGLISYYKAIEPDFVNKVLDKYGTKFGINIEDKAKYLINQI